MMLLRWRGLGRAAALLLMLAGAGGVAAAAAQSTGKIEGHVKDAAGQPIANATVLVVGSSFSARTDARGYYFIENIPASQVSVRAMMIKYRPVELSGLRIMAGQTTTGLDFALEMAPIQLDVIQVVAKNPLVPRDVVATKQTITGDAVRGLPADRILQVLALQPGVVQVGNCNANQPCTPAISVRGGRTDQNATYIDGVPVQNGIHGQNGGVGGAPTLTIGTNGFEEASVTTGASSAAFGNAQAGIINISTRGGGNRFAGSLGYETGLLGLAYYGQGLNTFKGSIGGPIGKHLNFFLSTQIEGNNTTNGGNHGWLFPGYSRVKIDTTFTIAAATKANTTGTPSDSVKVSVFDYAVTEGGCDNSAAAGGYKGANDAAMAANYGVTCYANQAYTTPSTNYFTSDKLNYSFGQGSRLTLSYNFSGNQQRSQIQDGRAGGQITGSSVATLNWNQTLIKSTGHQLTLDAYISRQSNNLVGSTLTASSESATRSSPGGFIFSKFKFDVNPSDYPVDSALIWHVLTQDRNHRIGIINASSPAQYNGLAAFGNGPPDGVGSAAGGGGISDQSGLNYRDENRWVGIANVDFQADRYNRLKVGAQFTRSEIQNYNTAATNVGLYALSYSLDANGKGHLTPGANPVQYNAYAEDRLDLGDVVLVAGLRYDYYDTKAWRWNGYPEISSRPNFSPDSMFCPVGATANSFASCALIQEPSHNYLSPHVQVSFPVTDKTNFRLSYAQNVQAPDFGIMYQQALTDINAGGPNNRSNYGGSLDFGKTISFEFGARHAFSDDMVLDVAVYNNDIVANPAERELQNLCEPISGSCSSGLNLIQNSDFGNTRGIDVRLDRRIGNYLNGTLSYTFQDSKNTGADPTSYLGFFENASGFAGDPPAAALPTALSKPHTLSAVFALNLPSDWEKGTVLGSVLNRTGVFVTARIASGAPYTKCQPGDANSINTISGNSCASLNLGSNFNAARLPMTKQFDMKVTRDFRVGKYQFNGYVDMRNVFNLQNITSVYAQTGTTSSGLATAARWSADSSTFNQFGKNSSTLRTSDGAILLPGSATGSPTIAGCSKMIISTTSAAPACFYYIRSEQRFGNGDGVYTLAEQRAASDSKNAAANSIWSRNTGARTVRFGMEVNF